MYLEISNQSALANFVVVHLIQGKAASCVGDSERPSAATLPTSLRLTSEACSSLVFEELHLQTNQQVRERIENP